MKKPFPMLILVVDIYQDLRVKADGIKVCQIEDILIYKMEGLIKRDMIISLSTIDNQIINMSKEWNQVNHSIQITEEHWLNLEWREGAT